MGITKAEPKAEQAKHFADGDEWMLAEAFPGIDFFFSQIWLRAFVNRLENSCGRNYSKILAVFDGSKQERNHIAFYYGKRDCLEMTKHLVKKITEEPSFGEKINENIRRCSDELVAHAKTIPNEEQLAKASNAELWRIISEHDEKHGALYEWGWLSNATDMFYPEFTNYLKNYLKTKALDERGINEVLVALTAPEAKSEEALQHEEFLELAARFWADAETRELFAKTTPTQIIASLKPEKLAELQKFAEKYAVIGALYVAEPFPLEHFVSELKTELGRGDPKRALAAANEAFNEAKRRKKTLLEELEVDEKTRRIFAVYADFMLTKFYRRYAQIRALYELRRVFKEIARRFGITLNQARFMLTPEYEKLLVDKCFDLKQLAEREKFCVLYSEKNYDEIFIGEKARELAAKAEEKHEAELKELKGQCASLGAKPGIVRGTVKIISSPKDLPKMRSGDVLVAIATNPDVVPAMKKAAAIVTDQGGVTCHAAIVSRELRIPCVIGTKHATRVLRDGDEVEVDAARGVVRKTSYRPN
ncbi:MAG: PEP-utilizing enzyme [Candidatus Norongarragalinales archaeon]